MRWLIGFQEVRALGPGDGGQAKLEKHIDQWLTLRGNEAAESTIREHVKASIKEYKASVSAAD